MECPKCKLVNPATAMICDCGYDFQSGTTGATKKSYLELINDDASRYWSFLFAIWSLLLVPWFYILGLIGMLGDSGDPLSLAERIVVASIVTYPVMLAISLIFRRKLPALVLLPFLNLVIFDALVVGWAWTR